MHDQSAKLIDIPGEILEADMERIADHFGVTTDDVLDRLAMMERQRKMTQAFLAAAPR